MSIYGFFKDEGNKSNLISNSPIFTEEYKAFDELLKEYLYDEKIYVSEIKEE